MISKHTFKVSQGRQQKGWDLHQNHDTNNFVSGSIFNNGCISLYTSYKSGECKAFVFFCPFLKVKRKIHHVFIQQHETQKILNKFEHFVNHILQYWYGKALQMFIEESFINLSHRLCLYPFLQNLPTPRKTAVF